MEAHFENESKNELSKLPKISDMVACPCGSSGGSALSLARM